MNGVDLVSPYHLLLLSNDAGIFSDASLLQMILSSLSTSIVSLASRQLQALILVLGLTLFHLHLLELFLTTIRSELVFQFVLGFVFVKVTNVVVVP